MRRPRWRNGAARSDASAAPGATMSQQPQGLRATMPQRPHGQCATMPHQPPWGCVQRCLNNPKGCAQRCLNSPWKLRGEAMLQALFDAPAHGAQFRCTEHCSRNFVCHVTPRNECRHHLQYLLVWLTRRRASPVSTCVFDPMVSERYCACVDELWW